jgi:hypothetical protein
MTQRVLARRWTSELLLEVLARFREYLDVQTSVGPEKKSSIRDRFVREEPDFLIELGRLNVGRRLFAQATLLLLWRNDEHRISCSAQRY